MKNRKLLQEYYELCPDGNCVLDVLTESEKKLRENGTVFLVGVCQRAGTENGNGRVYPREVLQREVQRYQGVINERRALGELDHPDSSVVELKNASHVMTEVWWKGDDVMGKMKILNTPAGQIAKQLVEGGVQLGISSRGLGSTRQEGNTTMVEDDFQLLCFDLVSEPSTTGAFLVAESKVKTHLTKADRINRALNDVLGED